MPDPDLTPMGLVAQQNKDLMDLLKTEVMQMRRVQRLQLAAIVALAFIVAGTEGTVWVLRLLGLG